MNWHFTLAKLFFFKRHMAYASKNNMLSLKKHFLNIEASKKGKKVLCSTTAPNMALQSIKNYQYFHSIHIENVFFSGF
jgi:hypothetical protein